MGHCLVMKEQVALLLLTYREVEVNKSDQTYIVRSRVFQGSLFTKGAYP